MPREKYKVSELAKDFDFTNKEMIEFLSENSIEDKKTSSALVPKEFDIVFNLITDKYAVESFDEYFAKGEKAREAKKEKEEAEKQKEAETAEKALEEKKEAKASPDKAAEEKQEEKSAEKKTEKKAAESKTAASPEKKTQSQPAQKKEKEAKEHKLQARTKGEARHVDTRANNIDLEKYNEKYDEMASTSTRGREMGPNKQKLNQKSKQQYQGKKKNKRETEAERLKRIAEERAKRPQIVVKVADEITVGELASQLKMTAAEVIKKLFSYGIMATVNQTIDYDTAEVVATDLGAKVEKQVILTIEDRIIDDSEDKEEDLILRDPVVCVMGHVDHGKTSILDAIRNTAVTETEAGGITQHIGAYRVEINGKKITFLDTPGHAAFTAMRARGAMATDIAVLVVAADDGIMPQTIEAINHAKAAEVQIIVAINKMDKQGANPDRIMQQLTEHGLVPEEWGGDTICVPVSAKTHMGIDSLLESILLVAEMGELRANPNRAAKGVVIEARLDRTKGPIATLLVQNGTLNSGDIIVAGMSVGKVRVMTNDRGHKVEKAGPSVPVEIMGLDETPNAGDEFNAVSDERLARELVEQRKDKAKQEQFNAYNKVTLENLFESMQQGEMKELKIVVKADVQGSVEAVKQNLEKLSNDEVRVKVIHGGVGAINESDVMLAGASNAIIVGFNVRPNAVAETNAERDGVDMRMYRVIYDCLEEVEAAMKGMLAPKQREVSLGKVEVRNVMNLSSAGKIAGSYVLEGKVTRSGKIRVVRDGIVVAEDEIASLRRFKDDVKEVSSGFECGIGLTKFNDIKEGDIFEVFFIEEYRE